jgi:spermidine synthase
VQTVIDRKRETSVFTNRGTGSGFFVGLLLLSAGTLMYEVILTRLLSVVCWYYLAFVSVSMAMFGMTAGALMVQLRPAFFSRELLPRRLYQSALAMAISMPVTLLIMLAIPLDISVALQTAVSFLLFSSVIAVPFFFSGVAVCIALTRMSLPMGQVYFVDLAGAALGCLGAVGLLSLTDAPSAMFYIAALLFIGAAAFGDFAHQPRAHSRCLIAMLTMLVAAGLNSSTAHGIQPIWAKGQIDIRREILTEQWNPISKVRFYDSRWVDPLMYGPSPYWPERKVEAIDLDIDNNASTQILRFDGNLARLSFMRYDATAIGAQLRRGGTAAIIGVGGGRDVLNCALNRFTRIVGIEVNSAIYDMTSHYLDAYSGFSKIPGLELHNDEGRSFLARSSERFDLIQASFVDTWAATAAGAMTLSENSLYTVDGWRVFYSHLKPGGIITFSRWYTGSEKTQTYRLFSVAYAMLLSEGVADPSRNLILIQSGPVATLLASNQPFSASDIAAAKSIAREMDFTPIFVPGEPTDIPELQHITQAGTVAQMASLQDEFGHDYSPTFDGSPYFFNSVRIETLPRLLYRAGEDPVIQATLFLLAFMLAALILVVATIAIPARMAYRRQRGNSFAPALGLAYFASIGLGFMCVEMAMMQQLSIFLGEPVYSLVVVLASLILSTGIGSLVSDRWPARSAWQCRIPPAAGALLVVVYFSVVLPVMHAFTAALLWQRVLLCLLLIVPPGFALGFCFPIGLRWMKALSEERNLPWMWAMNGSAGTLGSFVAMLVSMETSIPTCLLTGAAFYLLAAALVPRRPGLALRRPGPALIV